MNTHSSSRPRTGSGAAHPRIAILLGLLVAIPVTSNPLQAGSLADGFVIHSPEEVLRDYCQRDGSNRLWLVLPGGARYELVTSTADPVIANPGDGAFHPYDALEVEAALAAVRFPLDRVRAEVLLLPYPRRVALESAAGPGLILLAPGVRPLSRAHQHAELVHELGHVVQYALMPDRDADRWTAYRRLRGIQDAIIYSASSPHRDRPHEIFAEDFRALFGGSLAVASGTIENPSLAPPQQIEGLERFMLGLGPAVALAPLAAEPNPSRGAVRFASSGTARLPLDLYDAAGRRLVTLEPSGGQWRWDGRDAAGRRVAPGVVYARLRGGSGAATRVTLIP